MLKYDPGQFYKAHHDQNAHPRSPWGPRVFTFFMYLSDVEAGGATRFTKLDMEVAPKKGRALLWPSVFDDDVGALRKNSDDRTYHEAMPVEAGVKFAANFWLHLYDFQTPHKAACTNSDHDECGGRGCVHAAR